MEENNEKRFIGTRDEYTIKLGNSSKDLEEILKERKEQKLTEGMQKYMPIGSIISINNPDDLKMIIGFNPTVNGKRYDYIACDYPYGIDINHKTIAFNHENIDRVYFIGYVNNQERVFKKGMDSNKKR